MEPDAIHSKIEGQLAVLQREFPAASDAAGTLDDMLSAVDSSELIKKALVIEAKAASVYWGAWSEVPMIFARTDERHVPGHWLNFGERHSPLSTSARKAASPTGAILNYLYALAEFECRLALLAVGLDPGLGWAHRDAPYRDSATLDLLEPLRPAVDWYVLSLLRTRTFSKREFIESRTGQVRLAPALARSLAATLPMWERAASLQAERIARILAASASSDVRIPSRKTRGAHGKGHNTLGRRAGSDRRVAVPSACRACGVLLETAERVYCPDCIPRLKKERTDKLVSAARAVLAEMRGSEHDPAQTDEAKAKRVAAYKHRKEAARAWERQNPGPHDSQTYRAEILPGLAGATLPQMMRATGLTSGYCWKIRRGERIPHPMYWEALRALG